MLRDSPTAAPDEPGPGSGKRRGARKPRAAGAVLDRPARECSNGSVQLLAVLDLEKDALAAEAARLAAMAEGAPPVEVVDRASRACVQRLQAIGVLQRAETTARVLHRAA